MTSNLEKEFEARGIRRGGILLLGSDAASALIHKAKDQGVRVLGSRFSVRVSVPQRYERPWIEQIAKAVVAAITSLEPSGRRGLLGAPIPKGGHPYGAEAWQPSRRPETHLSD